MVMHQYCASALNHFSNCQVNFLTFVDLSGIFNMCIASWYLAGTIVQTTISMQNMLAKARGTGSIPPGNFENVMLWDGILSKIYSVMSSSI